VRAAYAFSNLQDFLDIYYAGADVLRTKQDFEDLATAYFDRAAADGVLHAEIMFDPQTHTARGIALAVVVEGLLSAMAQAQARHGMTSALILSFLRHLSEEDAFATLAQAEPWLDRIAAVGLDSSELGHPPGKFARVFAAAEAKGLRLVVHAGEEGPPAYVRLAGEGMTLTVCPLSNLKLCVIDAIENHPIDAMLAKGLRVTVNSDDPAYFGGYVADNYRAVAAARGLGPDQLATLARNSFTGSFLPADAVAAHLARIDAFMAAQA
jgi:adenosine deaminase